MFFGHYTKIVIDVLYKLAYGLICQSDIEAKQMFILNITDARGITLTEPYATLEQADRAKRVLEGQGAIVEYDRSGTRPCKWSYVHDTKTHRNKFVVV